jgi:hypothetical protein
MDQVISPNWPLWEIAKTALALLGLGGLTIAGAVTVAFAFFKWFGASWIENKFKIELELYKSEQSRELAKLNHKINGLLDRTVRLHAKEFEVLPDLYEKLVEAHGWAASFVSPMQRYADVRRMNDTQLDEFLNGTEFMDVQKNEIKDASGQESHPIYRRIADIYSYNDACKRLRDFSTAFQKKIIFVHPALQKNMEVLDQLIHAAIHEKYIDVSEELFPRSRVAYDSFQAEAGPLLEKIKHTVSDRLWNSTTTEV